MAAMAGLARVGGGVWRIEAAENLAGLSALSIRFAGSAAGAADLVLEPAWGVGGTWTGAVRNRGDGLCLDVSVRLEFLDAAGRVVGEARAEAARLAPGGRLIVAAPGSGTAVAVRSARLRWRQGRAVFVAGPGDPQPLA